MNGAVVSDATVVLTGLGTVFFGLIVIILLCKLMHALIGSKFAAAPAPAAVTRTAPAMAVNTAEDTTALKIAAAVAIAEMTGTDAAGIRIVSFKKL